MRNKIMPNDVVLHKPTGEKIIVCGVNHEKGELVACGYPFPSIMKTADCEIVERNYEHECQSEEYIKNLIKYGLTSFIDVRSAMFHGVL
jgi:hypothetical protein